ncbi:gliding motility protein GldL [Flavobacterium sp. xlx-214]|uniref:gliding motility protein GldL n=1 Tax=unclassified Flavobacterium TaxID=196869 RepID=UPI0013D3D5BA|nr:MULTISPECIES: gliding motility protein GldL [unclassified Flavobacterium]MBA5791485.1 gliding motility protein GldL [Flavobacterium sp. xlx-221]QMI83365.1 gliding motility protein GldL [Flavobacterium sp. xlx-214]
MKTKHTLIILLIGFIIILIGAVLKIIHLEIGPLNGNSGLTVGIFVEVIGGVLLLFKLITAKKSNDFLNS